MSKIIFLNGCGSAGKTTIAKHLQSISTNPWLYLGMDNFSDMLPNQYVGSGEKATIGYYTFTKEKNHRGNLIKVGRGPLGAKFYDTLPSIAKILADSGNDLIIDEVVTREANLKGYINALTEHIVYFIGVYCDLQTLQERELFRGDRLIGLANGQYDVVHSYPRIYDLQVDSSQHTGIKIAEDILDYVEQNLSPQSFHKMQSLYDGNNI